MHNTSKIGHFNSGLSELTESGQKKLYIFLTGFNTGFCKGGTIGVRYKRSGLLPQANAEVIILFLNFPKGDRFVNMKVIILEEPIIFRKSYKPPGKYPL